VRLESSSFEFLFAPETCWHGINQEKEKADKREAPEPLAHAGTHTESKEWFDLTGTSSFFREVQKRVRSRDKNASNYSRDV